MPTSVSHKGPHAGLLALLYTLLFWIGLYPVTAMYKSPFWPGPWEPASVIVSYFQNYSSRVLFCTMFQLSAFLCFGLFAMTIVSRLRFLGAKSTGTYIALLGSMLVLSDAFAGTMVIWTMLHPGVIENTPTLLALYYLAYALGGPGFSVPMGLFLAGISITAGFTKLLPRWFVAIGILLALVAELSLLHLLYPKLLFLVPLTRFPGFLWLTATGFLLPKSRKV